MLKDARHQKILELVNANKIMRVTELTDILNVSSMTIRRDLVELEEDGSLIKVHGGARSKQSSDNTELSHYEKQNINIEAKLEAVAKLIECIEDGENIFIGAGTTLELVPNLLTQKDLRIITNSLHVFNVLQENTNYEIILLGGTYRSRTGAFIGSITNTAISSMKTDKAFIGVNGIYNNLLTNYNEEEGNTQKMILDNAKKKYIIADSSKIGVLDFYHFYNLEDVDALITDTFISEQDIENCSKYTEVLTIAN